MSLRLGDPALRVQRRRGASAWTTEHRTDPTTRSTAGWLTWTVVPPVAYVPAAMSTNGAP